MLRSNNRYCAHGDKRRLVGNASYSLQRLVWNFSIIGGFLTSDFMFIRCIF